ncbi:class F sortase [Candidatus Saccharibacteria bacterium]|nr:class F sortase [Candidatus Saccharibacteria bacterium]
MGFRIEKSKAALIPKILLLIAIILLGLFFLKIKIWEDKYYAEKEGSERAITVKGDIEANEVSEEPITEQQKAEYIVAPDMPRYLHIEKLGIRKARIMEVGVNAKGQMQTPYSIFDAGWYNGSAKPGTGGTSIIDGHNGGPGTNGIFKNLNTLTAGDEIMIEMGNGAVYNYRVYDNFEVKLSEADKKMSMLTVSPVAGQESISIISCIGEWSQKQQTYLSRQFLRATRV